METWAYWPARLTASFLPRRRVELCQNPDKRAAGLKWSWAPHGWTRAAADSSGAPVLGGEGSGL